MACAPSDSPPPSEDQTRAQPSDELPTVISGTSGGTLTRVAPGTRLGPYLVRRLLGSGGMGDVYECEDVESGRSVAVKTLRPNSLTDASRNRFLREGRLAAALSHPNTVYVFASAEIDGVPIIAMELVTGGTLADRLRQDGPMTVRDAVTATRQIIDGLAAAADRGILHRDVKPANCFVDAVGVVKVGDFGLSVSADRNIDTQLTLAHTFLGTPAFASPEQLRGDDLDARSDIYSVGATMYFLLSGHPPFEDTNLMKLLSQVASAAPKGIQSWRPDVPDDLAEIIQKCLGKAPAARFANYALLAAALEPFAGVRERARPLRRGVAFMLDFLIGSFPQLPLAYVDFADGLAKRDTGSSLTSPGALLLNTLLLFLYFTLFEGRWGATPGKAALGLEVASAAGGPAGLSAAAARAAMVLGIGYAAGFIAYTTLPPRVGSGTIQDLMTMAAPILLMIVGRRGWTEGWHDRLTGTRVVGRVSRSVAKSAINAIRLESAVRAGRSIGPYELTEDSRLLPDGFTRAYDPRLRREVWVRLPAPGTPPVPSVRRDLARPTRQRWVGGRRGPEAGDNWDAYEAIEGAPITSALNAGLPWDATRRAIAGLAAEVEASMADATGPFQRIDDVWFTAGGEVKVVEPREGAVAPATASVAIAVIADIANRAARHLPPPLHVHDVVHELAAEKLTPAAAAAALRVPRPTAITRRRRVGALAMSALLPVANMLMTALALPLFASLGATASQGRTVAIRMLILGWVLAAGAGLIFAFALRGGMGFRFTDLVVVTADGALATRARAATRALLAWTPILVVATTLLIPFHAPFVFLDPHVPGRAALALGIAVFVAGAVAAVVSPERGWQDRIAGTWITPR